MVVAKWKMLGSLIIASLWHGSVVGAPRSRPLRPETFLKQLSLRVEGEEVRDCRLTAQGGVLALLSEKSLGDGDGFTKDKELLLSFYSLPLRRLKQLVVHRQKGSSGFNQKKVESLHYAVAFEQGLLATCRSKVAARSSLRADTPGREPGSPAQAPVEAEVDLWDLKLGKKINYFKADGLSCSMNFRFSKDASKLALLSPELQGNLALWDVATGIRQMLPEGLRTKHCHNLNGDFTNAFCSDDEASVGSYNLLDGNPSWRLERPEEYRLGRIGKAVKRLYRLFGKDLPKRFYNPLQSRPALIQVDEEKGQIFSLFRFAEERRFPRDQDYPGVLVTSQIADGKLIASASYLEDAETQLTHLNVFPHDHWLIGEDAHHRQQNFTSWYIVDFTGKRQWRLGVTCASSWFWFPAMERLLSCGHCEGKNKFQTWDIKARLIPKP